MPTKPKLLKQLTIFFTTILFCIGIIYLFIASLYYNESAERFQHLWNVEAIIIDGQNVGYDFEKRLSFMPKNEALLANHKDFYKNTTYGPIKHSSWQHQRKGLTEGIIIIDDKEQDIFDGVYEIEVLSYHKPQLFRLYSDRIEIHLREFLYFSATNRTIEDAMEWNIPTKSD